LRRSVSVVLFFFPTLSLFSPAWPSLSVAPTVCRVECRSHTLRVQAGPAAGGFLIELGAMLHQCGVFALPTISPPLPCLRARRNRGERKCRGACCDGVGRGWACPALPVVARHRFL